MLDGETSQDDTDDGKDDIEEYFEVEKPVEAKPSSDGKLLFSHKSEFIKYWNNMVIVLAMYNSVTIPMAIFYGNDGLSLINGEYIALIDALVDLIFLIDVIITFRTTFLDTEKGTIVYDTHTIARKYLHGSFAVDVASSVPFGAFVPESQEQLRSVLNLLGLLKLLRISRLS